MANMLSNLFGKQYVEEEEEKEQLTSLLEDRIRALQKRIASLEKRVEALEKQETKEEKTEEVSESSSESLGLSDFGLSAAVVSATDVPQKAEEPTQWYLAAPTADGTFPSVSSQEQIGKSIYLLTTSDNMNGTFSILDTSDAIATASISISQFVKPVCKVNGNASAFPRHIITDEEGALTKENGIWKVTRKAIVHFE